MVEFRWTGPTPPDEERKACKDCCYLKGAVSLWCTNNDAHEYRKTSQPGIRDCQFWEPMHPASEKKKGFFKRMFDFSSPPLIVNLSLEGKEIE